MFLPGESTDERQVKEGGRREGKEQYRSCDCLTSSFSSRVNSCLIKLQLVDEVSCKILEGEGREGVESIVHIHVNM